jgi:hypothetical protein
MVMDEALARLNTVSETNDVLAASVLNACAELASIASAGRVKERRSATYWRRKVLRRAHLQRGDRPLIN